MPGLMREKRGGSISKLYTEPTNPHSYSEFKAHFLNWDICERRSYIASSDDLLGCVHRFLTSRTHIWAPWFLGKLWGVGVSCRAMRSLSVRKRNGFKAYWKSTVGENGKAGLLSLLIQHLKKWFCCALCSVQKGNSNIIFNLAIPYRDQPICFFLFFFQGCYRLFNNFSY